MCWVNVVSQCAWVNLLGSVCLGQFAWDSLLALVYLHQFACVSLLASVCLIVGVQTVAVWQGGVWIIGIRVIVFSDCQLFVWGGVFMDIMNSSDNSMTTSLGLYLFFISYGQSLFCLIMFCCVFICCSADHGR